MERKIGTKSFVFTYMRYNHAKLKTPLISISILQGKSKAGILARGMRGIRKRSQRETGLAGIGRVSGPVKADYSRPIAASPVSRRRRHDQRHALDVVPIQPNDQGTHHHYDYLQSRKALLIYSLADFNFSAGF
jgi:hypothetical protein